MPGILVSGIHSHSHAAGQSLLPPLPFENRKQDLKAWKTWEATWLTTTFWSVPIFFSFFLPPRATQSFLQYSAQIFVHFLIGCYYLIFKARPYEVAQTGPELDIYSPRWPGTDILLRAGMICLYHYLSKGFHRCEETP